ncbi:uncharacterized protein LOC127449653 [Myxocyprinus asiaticus]|uniref:uncharacterized protein LOC127449653 n=1 Tax=Myxocyprinus asiaticus TaxID=70543 RepID=UPI00222258B9|nr:uncharacterized protein LOC127449653 [Myxocyprinus asiaticus]
MRQAVLDEIRPTLVIHVLVHGTTMKEAGQRVQPNLSHFTVASIIRTFREENRTQRQPPGGGRLRLLSEEQERELRIFEIEGQPVPHEIIFFDEAGFNLTKRRRGRKMIGHRTIVNVLGQRGGNVTICTAISQRGVLHRHAILGPYNTMLLLGFPDGLRECVFQLNQREPAQPEQPRYIVVWDNVSFHRAALVRDWFTNNPRFSNIFLPAYSPFLNPIEEFYLRNGGGKCMTENLTSVFTPPGHGRSLPRHFS